SLSNAAQPPSRFWKLRSQWTTRSYSAWSSLYCAVCRASSTIAVSSTSGLNGLLNSKHQPVGSGSGLFTTQSPAIRTSCAKSQSTALRVAVWSGPIPDRGKARLNSEALFVVDKQFSKIGLGLLVNRVGGRVSDASQRDH